MNCLRSCHLAKVQEDKIAFVPRKPVERTLKAQLCTTVTAAITADYFAKRKDAAAASAMPATQLKWPASFARRGDPSRQKFILVTHPVLPVPQLESEFTYLHVIITALALTKPMIQMLLCFHRNLWLGQYSTWEDSQAIACTYKAWLLELVWLFRFWRQRFFIYKKKLMKNLKEESEKKWLNFSCWMKN